MRERIWFSKKLVILSWGVTLLLTALAVLIPIFSYRSIEGLVTALPLSWGELAAVNGFYLWKSKNENRYKYTQQFIRELSEIHGVDAALRAAEIVLKD